MSRKHWTNFIRMTLSHRKGMQTKAFSCPPIPVHPLPLPPPFLMQHLLSATPNHFPPTPSLSPPTNSLFPVMIPHCLLATHRSFIPAQSAPPWTNHPLPHPYSSLPCLLVVWTLLQINHWCIHHRSLGRLPPPSLRSNHRFPPTVTKWIWWLPPHSLARRCRRSTSKALRQRCPVGLTTATSISTWTAHRISQSIRCLTDCLVSHYTMRMRIQNTTVNECLSQTTPAFLHHESRRHTPHWPHCVSLKIWLPPTPRGMQQTTTVNENTRGRPLVPVSSTLQPNKIVMVTTRHQRTTCRTATTGSMWLPRRMWTPFRLVLTWNQPDYLTTAQMQLTSAPCSTAGKVWRRKIRSCQKSHEVVIVAHCKRSTIVMWMDVLHPKKHTNFPGNITQIECPGANAFSSVRQRRAIGASAGATSWRVTCASTLDWSRISVTRVWGPSAGATTWRHTFERILVRNPSLATSVDVAFQEATKERGTRGFTASRNIRWRISTRAVRQPLPLPGVRIHSLEAETVEARHPDHLEVWIAASSVEIPHAVTYQFPCLAVPSDPRVLRILEMQNWSLILYIVYHYVLIIKLN